MSIGSSFLFSCFLLFFFIPNFSQTKMKVLHELLWFIFKFKPFPVKRPRFSMKLQLYSSKRSLTIIAKSAKITECSKTWKSFHFFFYQIIEMSTHLTNILLPFLMSCSYLNLDIHLDELVIPFFIGSIYQKLIKFK